MGKFEYAVILIVSIFLVQFFQVTNWQTSAGSPSVAQLWRFETAGSVSAPPVVKDGYVYAISSLNRGYVPHLYCLNASTGTQIWSFSFDSFIYSSPPIIDDVVFVASIKNGTIIALDRFTGNEKWIFKSHSSFLSLPVFADEHIFVVGNDGPGTIYCLNKTNGSLIWENPLSRGRVGSPILAEDRIYVNYGDYPNAGICAINPTTGDQVWNYTLTYPVRDPIVADDIVYVGTYDFSDTFPYTIITAPASIIALNSTTGKKLWNNTIGGWIYPDLVANGVLFASANNSNLYAFDGLSGRKLWNRTMGAPSIVNGNLYASYSYNMYCLDASTGRQKWVHEADGKIVSSPVLNDSQLYVSSYIGYYGGPNYIFNPQQRVYSLNAFSGKESWRYSIEGKAVALTLDNGVIYVAAGWLSEESYNFEGNGAIYALEPRNVYVVLFVDFLVIVAVSSVMFLVYRGLKGTKKAPQAGPILQPYLQWRLNSL